MESRSLLQAILLRQSQLGEANARQNAMRKKDVDAIIDQGVARGAVVAIERKAERTRKGWPVAMRRIHEKVDLVESIVATVRRAKPIPVHQRKARNIIVAKVIESDVAMFLLAKAQKAHLKGRRKVGAIHPLPGKRESVDRIDTMTPSSHHLMMGNRMIMHPKYL